MKSKIGQLLLVLCLFALGGLAVLAQGPVIPQPIPEVEGVITVKIIPGVHAVLRAPADRVTLQHEKGDVILFIDTRPAPVKSGK